MHEVLVNRLGGLSLPRKSVVRLTDRYNMTIDAYRGRKTTTLSACICRLLLYSYIFLLEHFSVFFFFFFFFFSFF